ncbi:D-alanine--D-alanine ligase [Mesorhizobium sp.]|uniref:D-alanine--D-alanine ligase n=1 Tax=Mesorhizobium sp. TaxID=1871066 RepID=UPI001220D37D|nr:D-alanine--D-alanine ligase [Mesorhizobium sp.]TIP39116.1 MAG: D-alanine--D-alanine ligase [Mesorhizobium sp.]
MRPEVSFIFGGISSEYDSSVSSFKHVIATYLGLPQTERPFKVKNIHHVSKNGLVRTLRFRESFSISDLHNVIYGTSELHEIGLINAICEIDSRKEFVVNLLHGQFGEDGGMQTLAALLGLKGTFGDPQVASLTMNKYAMSSFVSSLLPKTVVTVPKTILITPSDKLDASKVASSFRGPIVVKPNSLGSSLLTEVFHQPATSAVEIVSLVNEILQENPGALLQEFVFGREYSCGCIVDKDNVITLPVMEIKTTRGFFGRNEKFQKDMFNLEAVDGHNNPTAGRIKSASRIIASAVGLYNMARFDFIVTPRSEIAFLECNYIPGMAGKSVFTAMLEHHGMTVVGLIDWVMSNSKQYARKDCLRMLQ